MEPEGSFHVHKDPPLVPIVSHINPVHTTLSYLRLILTLAFHLNLSSHWSLSFWFSHQTPTFTSLLFHSCYMPCKLHHTWHCNIWQGVEVMKPFIMKFSPTSCNFIHLQSKDSPQHSIQKYLWSVSVFLVVSFFLVFPPKSYIHSSSLPCVPHALQIASYLTWSL
jgi:hypothetical protein